MSANRPVCTRSIALRAEPLQVERLVLCWRSECSLGWRDDGCSRRRRSWHRCRRRSYGGRWCRNGRNGSSRRLSGNARPCRRCLARFVLHHAKLKHVAGPGFGKKPQHVGVNQALKREKHKTHQRQRNDNAVDDAPPALSSPLRAPAPGPAVRKGPDCDAPDIEVKQKAEEEDEEPQKRILVARGR